MSTVEIKVPDIGDFDNVEVVEIMVGVGDQINLDDSLISVESDKAVMEIPSSESGIIKEVKVSIGDLVSEGSVIFSVEADKTSTDADSKVEQQLVAEDATPAAEAQTAPIAAAYDGDIDIETEVVVLGSGPGGYTAAFRAADLGKQVVLIEKDSSLGGVCLNVGCIPSKALLHVAEVVSEASEFAEVGVDFKKPKIDTDKLRAHKNSVIKK